MAPTPIRFGTDGWRAVVADDFTYDNVRAVAQGVAWYVGEDDRPLVVGHDSRFTAELFAQAAASVLAANGRQVVLLNRVAPTPAISWTIIRKHAAGAMAITASHNSAEFNGIKYKPDFGGSAPPDVVAKIEEQTARAQRDGVTTMAYEDALATSRLTIADPIPDYLAQIGTMVNLPRIRDRGLRILHEAMYGAGAGLVAEALGSGSTIVDQLHSERNPGFGGMHPEPIDRYMPEAMQRMATGEHDVCIANDGDADRVGIIDEHGRYVNQLQVMSLLAMYLLEFRGERGDIVRSITSSSMLDELGTRFGVTVDETPVGFKYIGQKMKETNALFGCEESGGYAFRGHIPERDGVLSGLMVAQMIIDYDKSVSELVQHLIDLVGPHAYARHDIAFPREGYDQRKQDVYRRFAEHEPKEFAGVPVARVRSDDGFKFYLTDGSWVLMRMSGTEPLMRVYAEAPTDARVAELLAEMERAAGVEEPAGVAS